MKFWLDWDWSAAETAFRNAITLDPSYGLAHRTLGIVLSGMTQHEAALSAVRRARELDPLDFVHHALSAQVAFIARDYPAAVDSRSGPTSSIRNSGSATTSSRRHASSWVEAIWHLMHCRRPGNSAVGIVSSRQGRESGGVKVPVPSID